MRRLGMRQIDSLTPASRKEAWGPVDNRLRPWMQGSQPACHSRFSRNFGAKRVVLPIPQDGGYESCLHSPWTALHKDTSAVIVHGLDLLRESHRRNEMLTHPFTDACCILSMGFDVGVGQTGNAGAPNSSPSSTRANRSSASVRTGL